MGRGSAVGKQKRRIRLFSANEFANICGVVNQTAISWINNGAIPATKTSGGQYRIHPEVVKHFLETRGMRVPAEVEEAIRENEQAGNGNKHFPKA